MIVSNIAGTTRDAIDTKVTWNNKDYVFIDTAGLRRKGKVKEEIERYSVIRTVTAVERADGMPLRKMTRPSTSIQRRSVRSFPLCHMHRLFLFLQKQARDFRSSLRISIQLSRIRHSVSRLVFSMRSFPRQLLSSSRRPTVVED